MASERLVRDGLVVWSLDANERPVLIVRGQSNLIDEAAAADLDRVRQLLDELESKEEIARLVDSAREAQSTRIFIGSENNLFSLSGSSVIVAPYRNAEEKIVGVMGIIGHRTQLCPHHPHGGLHRQGHWPPAHLIFRGRQPIWRLFMKSMDWNPSAMADETNAPEQAAHEHVEIESPMDVEPDPRDIRMAQLKEEAAQYKDRLLRTAADMENLRKRAEREKAGGDTLCRHHLRRRSSGAWPITCSGPLRR